MNHFLRDFMIRIARLVTHNMAIILIFAYFSKVGVKYLVSLLAFSSRKIECE